MGLLNDCEFAQAFIILFQILIKYIACSALLILIVYSLVLMSHSFHECKIAYLN